MSSEESDGDTVRSFRIKRLPWRDPELTNWLHRLDKAPLKNKAGKILDKRRNHRERIESDLESISRAPVIKLPINFYRREWLQAQNQLLPDRLEGTNTPFPLPKIDDFVPQS
jgi:hypothetical protein